MDWSSADELSLYAEVNDLIEFRTSGFGIFRRKRYARVFKIINQDETKPLTKRIQLVGVQDPNTPIPDNPAPKSMSSMLNGKVGRFVHKIIDNPSKNQKKGFVGKIVSFFSNIMDHVHEFFDNLRSKVEFYHEEVWPKCSYNLRSVIFHVGKFFLEAFFGILLLIAICVVIFLACWWLILAISCLIAVISHGSLIIFPMSSIF